MFKKTLPVSLALIFPALAFAAVPSDLVLELRPAGLSGGPGGSPHTVTVAPGTNLDYEVVAELSDGLNQGLAFFAFDLEFSGGALAQAQAPSSAAMLNFATPLGINNPAGFGGTPVAGKLLQIGGAQNTINQSFAAAPSGLVMTGIGSQGSPVVLVTGSLTAPSQPGSYSLLLSAGDANAISAGASGSPYWQVERAPVTGVFELIVDVSTCAGGSNYCTAKTNSAGCAASISTSGTPSLSGADDFVLTASDVINKQFGLFFFGTGPSNAPFMGGTLCVAGPHVRMTPSFSGGAGPVGTNCNGVLSRLLPQAVLINRGFQPGDQIFIQAWYRDTLHPDGTGIGLTDAVVATICP